VSSTNIVQSGIPSRSALRVAQLRAAHQLLDEPIAFADPIALPMLGPELEAAMRADPFVFNDPISRGSRAVLVIRSLFAENGLEEAVRAGVTQYVVLGAGLDTFAYRNPHAGLDVYEVDHTSTQEWKKSLLAQAGIAIPSSMAFVPFNFEVDRLSEHLQRAGFDADRPAYFSWLGVTCYLSRESVFDTFREVASLPKGTTIAFDYLIVRAMLNPVELVMAETVANAYAAQGEPWKTFFDPAQLPQELANIGFANTEGPTPEELNARYLARRKDGLRAGRSTWLMRATV
jgi:methyltransferase (TIGR00027 family)